MDRGTWRATVHGVTKEPGTTYQINKSKKYFLMLDIYGEGRNKKGGGWWLETLPLGEIAEKKALQVDCLPSIF